MYNKVEPTNESNECNKIKFEFGRQRILIKETQPESP